MTDNYKYFIPSEIDRKSVPLWYAIYVRSRYEKKVAEQLKIRQIEHFLPLVPIFRQWKDRKKTVKMPLFPGYVFIHIKIADKLHVLTADGVVYLVGFGGQAASIPESQIQDIQKLLDYPHLIEPSPYIEAGNCWVEITSGPLKGVRGKLLQRHGRRRLLVSIDSIQQAVYVEIDMSLVKQLKASEVFCC